MRDAHGARERIVWAAGMAAVYALGSFLWSLLGFTSPVAPTHFHEYSLSALATEIGGHLLFGLAAAALSLDARLIMLAGAESILIDVDHILPALNYPVEARLAHSVLFAFLIAVVLSFAGKGTGRLDRGVFFVTLSAVSAHLSYDVFAGNALFPILAPLSMGYVSFPYYLWPMLEFLAFVLSVVSWFPRTGRALALRWLHRSARIVFSIGHPAPDSSSFVRVQVEKVALRSASLHGIKLQSAGMRSGAE